MTGHSASTLLGTTRRALGAVRWYARAVIGADAYEVYLDRHQRLHPDQPALSRRDFWRAHQDGTDVRVRCC